MPRSISFGHVLRRVRRVIYVIATICSMLSFTRADAQARQNEKTVRLGLICGVQCEGPGYDALNTGLRQLGWVEGGNLIVDRRAGGGEQNRLPALAAELVALKPEIIVAVSPQPTRAAKDAAGNI